MGVIKLADAAMHVVKRNAFASDAPSCSWLAISRDMGAMITIVAAFESNSVKIEVIKYKTTSVRTICIGPAIPALDIKPTLDAIMVDAPELSMAIPSASIP